METPRMTFMTFETLQEALRTGDLDVMQNALETVVRAGDTETVPGLLVEEKKYALCSVLDQSSEDVASLYASRPKILEDSEVNNRDQMYDQGEKFDAQLSEYMKLFDFKITNSLQPISNESYPYLKKVITEKKKAATILKKVVSGQGKTDENEISELGWYARSAVLELLQEARASSRDFAFASRGATDNEFTDNLQRWEDDISDCFVQVGQILDKTLEEVEK